MAHPVPMVSFEDLRAFQAEHFIVSDQEPEDSYPATQTWDEAAGYEEYDDDGLGYYADGVKRTLTDEQIKIFRHSEIQSLLRERRRKAEAEAEAKEDAERESAVSRTADGVLKDAEVDGRVGQQHPEADDIASESGIEDVANEEPSEREPVDAQRDPSLKADAQVAQSGQPPKPPNAPPEAFRRRVISYDD